MTRIVDGMVSFAPGRACFFGEHQDYMGFPVISAPVNMGIRITFKGFNAGRTINVAMPDVGKTWSTNLDKPIAYATGRDYLASALVVLGRNNIKVARGFDCEVRGDLPIAAGVSSSSALVVSWINMLCHLFSDAEVGAFSIARWANEAEVVEFGESGGYMDHVTSAVGGLLYIRNEFSVEKLDLPPDLCLVLGDSLQEKETVNNIKNLRARVEKEVEAVGVAHPKFRINNRAHFDEKFIQENNFKEEYPLVYANLMNGLITMKALELFKYHPKRLHDIGVLMSEHHGFLRDYLGVSTDKIESMSKAAMKAGALGAKINGSGFGGTMIAITGKPKIAEKVAKAIEDAGGKGYVVAISDGSKVRDPHGILV